jgi:hypothetical protein
MTSQAKPKRIFDHEINAFNISYVKVACVEDGHRYHIGVHEGSAMFPVLDIRFQKGPVKEVGVNGITDEALIAVVLDRLRHFQEGEFRCRENALTITKLEEALHWLEHRAKERERRGVEGTSKV